MTTNGVQAGNRRYDSGGYLVTRRFRVNSEREPRAREEGNAMRIEEPTLAAKTTKA
jgi:hypothetical protein